MVIVNPNKGDWLPPIVERQSGNATWRLTPRALEIASVVGWETVEEAIMDTCATALLDPRGPSSIDSNPNPQVRIVHRLDQETETLLGLPVAVKTTGSRPDPRRATPSLLFDVGYALATAQQQLHPDGINGHFFFNQPLALWTRPVVNRGKHMQREWLIMERVPFAQPVAHRRMQNGHKTSFGFDSRVYPELGELAGGSSPHPESPWRLFQDIRFPLYQQLGGLVSDKVFNDFHGENILTRPLPDGTRRYEFIDIQPARADRS